MPTELARTIRFFLEMDFFGTSATTPRLRHAYAQGENLLVGQTFSNFMDPDASPDTLDFQGPNSQVSIRNPQMRYTYRLGKTTTTSISIEKPSSDVAFSTPDFNASPNSPSPDGTVQFRHDMENGHVQLAALFRDISTFLPDGRSDSVFGWGFNLAGLFKIGKDNLVYQGEYGNGISRYINDTSGLGIDAAVISVQDPRLEAVPIGRVLWRLSALLVPKAALLSCVWLSSVSKYRGTSPGSVSSQRIQRYEPDLESHPAIELRHRISLWLARQQKQQHGQRAPNPDQRKVQLHAT